MKSHLDHLADSFPSVLNGKVLDIGAGRGRFLIDVARREGKAIGIELNQQNIEIAKRSAFEAGVTIDIRKGVAEKIPFDDKSFDFVNMCELIEHVERPADVLKEVYRVLGDNGQVYMSVPNRFGIKDQHFGLYFVNWLPRIFSDKFISLFGKHKDYSGRSGFQRLSDMHYFTFKGVTKFINLVTGRGFVIKDIREDKIKLKFPKLWKIIMPFYRILRFFILDSCHLKLIKK